MDFDMYDDDIGLPTAFLERLQPAGAFLSQHDESGHSAGLQSPTSVSQYQSTLSAPMMTPKSVDAKSLLPAKTNNKPQIGEVAMSFLSAMRRGLDGLNHADDDEDEEEEEDDEEDDGSHGYYQPAYSQYHAPTASFTGRPCFASDLFASSQPDKTANDDDDLIFPMEL